MSDTAGGAPHLDPSIPGDELTLESFYDHAPCGYASTDASGIIVRANATLAAWLERPFADVVGTPVGELFSIGSRLYLETHIAPLIFAGQTVTEAAVELRAKTGTKPVLLAAHVHSTDSAGRPAVVRWTLVDISLRREYENDLIRLHEAALTEQRRSDELARIAARLAALADESQIGAALCGELTGAGTVRSARLDGPSSDLRGAPLYVEAADGQSAYGHLPLVGPRGAAIGTLRVELDAMPTDAEAAHLRDVTELAARAIQRARRPLASGPASWQMNDLGNGTGWQAILTEALAAARKSGQSTAILLVHVGLDRCSRDHGAVACDEALLTFIEAWRVQGHDLVSVDGHELYGAVLAGTNEQSARVVAERAKLRVSDDLLRINVGVVVAQGDGDPSDLHRRAERSLAADQRTAR